MRRETAIAVWADLNDFALDSCGALWGPSIEHAESATGPCTNWFVDVCFSGSEIRPDLHELCLNLAGKHRAEVAFSKSVTFS
jgi:hypothetical protein